MEEVTLLHGHLESHVLACRGAGVVGLPHREDQVRTRRDLEQMALTQLLDEFDAASRIPLALTDADVDLIDRKLSVPPTRSAMPPCGARRAARLRDFTARQGR